jgi:hypothetical protein
MLSQYKNLPDSPLFRPVILIAMIGIGLIPFVVPI